MAGPWERYQQQGGAIPIGTRNPRLPAQVQGDILGNQSTAAGTAGKVIDNRITAATADSTITEAEARARKMVEDAKIAAMTAAGITAPIRQEAITAYNQAMELLPTINKLQSGFDNGPGRTSGPAGLLDFIPGTNSGFYSTANQLRGTVKSTQGFTGGEGNTATESRMNIGAFIPDRWETDASTRAKLEGLRREQSRSSRTNAGILGGMLDGAGNVTPLPRGYVVGQHPNLDRALFDRLPGVEPERRGATIAQAKSDYERIMRERRGNQRRTVRFSDLSQGGR